jgi:PhnB protein
MAQLGLIPYITVSHAAAAIEFYKAAFGAEELSRHSAPGGDKIMHAHLIVHGSPLMLADDFPEYANGKGRTPEALGGSPVILALEVEDAQGSWDKALAAGATVRFPLEDQFWGERYGQVTDPFGHIWSIGQELREVSRDEAEKGAEEAFSKMQTA